MLTFTLFSTAALVIHKFWEVKCRLGVFIEQILAWYIRASACVYAILKDTGYRWLIVVTFPSNLSYSSPVVCAFFRIHMNKYTI